MTTHAVLHFGEGRELVARKCDPPRLIFERSLDDEDHGGRAAWVGWWDENGGKRAIGLPPLMADKTGHDGVGQDARNAMC